MAPLVRGDRIARTARGLTVATSAIVLDDRARLLLVRRRDTGLWGLPGGVMEPGESVSEAVAREVMEETGLEVRPVHLVGVYSDPDVVVTYPGVEPLQPVVIAFRCEAVGGVLRTATAETSEAAYWPVDALPPLVEEHRQRVADAVPARQQGYFR